MKRGEIWTVSGGADYLEKPRPAVILQSNKFWDTEFITLCPMTTRRHEQQKARMIVRPDEKNGLVEPSRIMVDKISTVPKSKLGTRIGYLAEAELACLTMAAGRFLGVIA